MVELPAPATIGDVAVTVDKPADTAPAVPVAVNVTGLPLIPAPAAVAVRVFGPAVVDSVQLSTVAIPPASVLWVAPVTPPFPGATANVTATPATGLPLASRTITDGGEATALPTGAAWGFMLLPVIAAADPAWTTTAAVCVTGVPPIEADTVLVAAAVELSVPVATPLALVAPTGCVSVLPSPVAASVTVAPAIGLPFTSRAVTVMVDVPLPAVIGDVAVTVDCAADTGAAFTVTVAVSVIPTVPFTVAVTVFVPAAVELNAPVICPLALVVPVGWVNVLAAPVAASVTDAPLTGLPKPSRTVTVMVAALEPVLAVMVPGAADTRD